MTERRYFYRYDNAHGRVFLDRYEVVRETPCGVWLQVGYNKTRFVKLRESIRKVETTKRWACPTVADAKVSFERRKKRQMAIMSAQLTDIEAALDALREGDVLQMYTDVPEQLSFARPAAQV